MATLFAAIVMFSCTVPRGTSQLLPPVCSVAAPEAGASLPGSSPAFGAVFHVATSDAYQMASVCGLAMAFATLPGPSATFAFYRSTSATANLASMTKASPDYAATATPIPGRPGVFHLGDTTLRFPIDPGGYYAVVVASAGADGRISAPTSLPINPANCSSAISMVKTVWMTSGSTAPTSLAAASEDLTVLPGSMELQLCPSCLPAPTAPSDGSVSIPSGVMNRGVLDETASYACGPLYTL
ncbi:uncharacterized protein AMSG_03523 [Thecamonas trahens ATCC 50062]|uniref:Uncharacterized protein n=1 Tax=Thecamonas trahens ATCC 50062 TaxID=461836 RepID=A0A0L0D428_THETB|nr:hypothetical protein AMSG_03523 [Thecamonas trahens ATCC 50062]KNC47097.1 hypothetical protein AMSG_03523 [Thecamonas trahens ATCC 50062]|eukprot:XP_013759875.1 hypothetical protein AMSG_03523 [Thecamonas trahens ATCC 50062]